MHIVLGSYDGSLIGLQVGGTPPACRTRFAYSPHQGCVKSLASNGKFLVSAGVDERVLVYDIKKKVEFGTLLKHEGTVTCAEFHSTSHLLTGSDDMTIVVWRTKDWMALRTLKGHKAKIAALAVHPSGKLALSSDTTGILHIWDLTTAKLAFKHRTKESSVVRWSPDGQAFASIHGDTAEISATSAELLSSCTSKGKLYDVRFIDDNTVVTAGEEKIIDVWDCRESCGKSVQQSAAFKTRIKSLGVTEQDGRTYIVGASAGGVVQLFDCRKMGKEPLLTRDTNRRLTCMQLVDHFAGEDADVHTGVKRQRVAPAAAAAESEDSGEDGSDEDAEDADADAEDGSESEGDDSSEEDAPPPAAASGILGLGFSDAGNPDSGDDDIDSNADGGSGSDSGSDSTE